jgi:hypothetical protein
MSETRDLAIGWVAGSVLGAVSAATRREAQRPH